MCSNGDGVSPKLRCRYVATEGNHGNDLAYYASTSPLESVRRPVAQFAMKQTRSGNLLALSFAGATTAYFHAKPRRDLFIRAPEELGLPPNTVGRLLRCAYGTRGAGALWEEHYAHVRTQLWFVRSRAGPTCFHHPKWYVAVVVPGDDVIALGTDFALALYEAAFNEAFGLG